MSGRLASQSAPYARSSKLVRYVTVAYLLLVVYASLYPFSDWRIPNDDVRAFLAAPWPPFLSWPDVALNVLGYLPLGFLLALTLLSSMRRGAAAAAASALGAALSLLFELIQVYLPARISSNVDLLCNAAGATAGAAFAAWGGPRWILSGDLHRLRLRWFERDPAVDLCFLLLLAWLATQLNAEIWLFGNGDLRHLLAAPAVVNYSAHTYLLLESGVASLGFAGVALMLTAVARSVAAAVVSVTVLCGAALGLKSLASATLFTTGEPWLWVTPGSLWGLAAGMALWAAFLGFGRPVRVVSAAVFLALGVALVNAAPENPYLAAALQVWQHGHYAALNGLTRFASAAWPFAAIACLAYAGRRLP